MSRFEDTFSRNNQDKELEYDDAASYFFFASILSTIFVPLLYNVIKGVFAKPKFDTKRIKSRWREELNTFEWGKRKYTTWFYLKIVIVVALFVLLLVCISKGSALKSLKSFDPYEILEIEESASEVDIKKAYRRLAKIWHPDVNPGDPEAQVKFITLNKAYRCLTDEEIKEKCKLHGNPDGTANYQVAIALPSVLLNKKNRGIILAMFFLVVIIFVPVSIWVWYSDREKYNELGVNKQSVLQTLAFMRNENVTIQNVMEMIARSVEFTELSKIGPGQGKALHAMQDEGVRTQMAKEKCPYLKPLYMINHYMKRGTFPDSLKEEMNLIHRKAPFLLMSMSEFQLSLNIQQIKMFQDMKPVTYNSFMNMINFTQLYFQAMQPNQSPYFQLPGMDEGIVTKIQRKLKKEILFGEVLKSEELREKVISCYEDAKDMERAKHYITLLPQVDFQVDAYVEEDGHRLNEIRADDFINIEFTITDLSIPEGQDPHYMQSLSYPYLKYVNWHIFVLDKNDKGNIHISDFRMAKGDKRVITEKITTRIGRPGTFTMRVLLKPDCYVGLEQERFFTFTVLEPIINKEVFVHPDDEEALKRPTLFNQLANQLKDKNDSDEEEEEEHETQPNRGAVISDESKEKTE